MSTIRSGALLAADSARLMSVPVRYAARESTRKQCRLNWHAAGTRHRPGRTVSGSARRPVTHLGRHPPARPVASATGGSGSIAALSANDHLNVRRLGRLLQVTAPGRNAAANEYPAADSGVRGLLLPRSVATQKPQFWAAAVERARPVGRRVDGVTYDHGLIIDRGWISKRKKGARLPPVPRRLRPHPLSAAENIPWRCRRW